MIRAKQSALNQDTNHGLLLIRKSEIDYYTNLNIAFGTQAALIGGFTYGVFLTDHLNGNGSDILVVVQSIYWVLAAATMTLAVHVILTTMFIHVLGPGLALNGPIGSMVKAAEGMKVEQKSVFVAFMLMVFLFSLSTVMLFWVVMNLYSAGFSTIVYLLGARYWWYYCERIYLRFYWKSEESRWRQDSILETEESPLPDDIESGHSPHSAASKGHPTPQGMELVVSPLGLGKGKDGGSSRNKSTHSSSDNAEVSQLSHKSSDIAMEGYLSKKVSHSVSDLSKESWDRKYFLLLFNGHLYMYKSRQSYRSEPHSPIHSRPVYLSDYRIDTVSDHDGHRSHQSFLITLSSIANSNKDGHQSQNWVLRCDTEEELQLWLGSMKSLAP